MRNLALIEPRQRPTDEELLEEWLSKLRRLHRGHWATARVLNRRGLVLGLWATGLSAMAGTTLFASWDSGSEAWRLVAGILSMAAAILVALQTFLNYPDRAHKHRAAGSQYGTLRRSTEINEIFPPDSSEDMKKLLVDLNTAWSETDATSPAVPQRQYDRASPDRHPVHPSGRTTAVR